LTTQNVLVARLSRENQDHVTSERERTRAEVIRAIKARKPSYKIHRKKVPISLGKEQDEAQKRLIVEEAML
jgi:hypothetical protein